MAEKDDELELGVSCCLVEYDTCFGDCWRDTMNDWWCLKGQVSAKVLDFC